MKRLANIMMTVGMVFLFCAPLFAAEAESVFEETYEETAGLTEELFEIISSGLTGEVSGLGSESPSRESMDIDKLIKIIDKLLANSMTLETSAKEMGKEEAVDEAGQMALYLNRIKKAFRTGEEKHAIAMSLSLYYLHFNNCLMVNTICLKEILHHHVEELKEALEKNDTHEILHLAEHLHIHSDQVYYAAMIYGKKIWQKFSEQLKTIADEMFEASQKGDAAAIQAGVERIQEPVDMLMKLIKE